MNIIKVKNYEEMSHKVAELILEQVKTNPESVLGLATGSTQEGAYKIIRESKSDFSKISTFNLDEYCGLYPDNPASYRYYMDVNLFNHINIKKENTHIQDGMSDNPAGECEKYEELIKKIGGIDLQLLGMGHNGHIAFIEPGDELVSSTHEAFLSEQTIKANSRFFKHYDEVPKSALSMGLKTIMNAKKIILAVNGSEKANVLKKALFGSVTTQIPASILQLHNDITIVTDCIE